MSSKVSALVSLRKLLSEMESDCGLSQYAVGEKDVLYAALDEADTNHTVSTAQIQNHQLVKNMPRATFFRALLALEESGKLVRPDGTRRGKFTVVLS